MNKLISVDELLAEFAKAIYMDVEEYITQNKEKGDIKNELSYKRFSED